MLNKVEILEVNDKQYPMMFTLNVVEEIQDEFGSLEAWENEIMPKKENDEEKEKEPNIKAFKKTITIMINEGIDFMNEENGTNNKFITEKTAGRIISAYGFKEINERFARLMKNSNVVENEEKNVVAPKDQ